MNQLRRLATSGILVLLAAAPAAGAGADVPATPRPRLQIINSSSQPIDIFWLRADRERVANGSVAAGKNIVITTTIGPPASTNRVSSPHGRNFVTAANTRRSSRATARCANITD